METDLDMSPEDHSKQLEEEQRKWRTFPRRRPAHIVAPGPGQESVWDYPRPPRVERMKMRIRVEFGGVVLGESLGSYRVLETSSPPVVYLPPRDVRLEYLSPGEEKTLCEWKGFAKYWSVRVGARAVPRAAWSYPDPLSDYSIIKDYLAFYPARMDACYVGDALVTAQPGDYYGGWITPEILGPFKGDPQTEEW